MSHFLEYFTSKIRKAQTLPNTIKKTTGLNDGGYNVSCVTTMADSTSFNFS